MFSASKYETQEEREVEISELRKEVIYLGEKILAECSDDNCRQTAVRLLCYTYPEIGETEKAEKLALSLSGLNPSDLLRSIYSGDKKYRHTQDCIHGELTDLLSNIECNNAPLDDGNRPYTTEELIIIYKKSIAILEIIFEDKNYGYYQQWIAWRYKEIAQFYAKLGDYENAVKNLKIASEHAIKSDLEFNADKEYTCLIFRGKKVGEVIHNVTGNDSMEQLDLMKYKVFDPIRDTKEFIGIEEELKKYAKKR
jgi:tetratricopeptide (TPR) repeat protein